MARNRNRCERAGVKVDEECLWPIAMLRIAMELKRPGAPSLEKVVAGVARQLGIGKARFEQYLAAQVGSLRAEATIGGER